jgi:DNA-binding PadR family transcriptional regulator
MDTKKVATTYRGGAADKNQISPIEEDLLHVLLGRESYGLQICQAFEEASGGKRRMSVGTLYPVLARLEAKGLVTSRMEANPNGGARRKYFRITPGGGNALSEARNFREKLSIWVPVSV